MYRRACVSLGTELVLQFKACFWPHLHSSLLNFWCCFPSFPSLLLSFISASVTVGFSFFEGYLPTLIWDPSKHRAFLHSSPDMCAEQGKMWVSWMEQVQLRSNKATLPSCFRLSTVNKCFFCGLLEPCCWTFVLLLAFLLFKMALQHRAEILSCGLEYRMALTCLMGKCVFHMLLPGLGCSAAGCEFSVEWINHIH